MRERIPERILNPEPVTAKRRRVLSADAFWKLMDRWQVPKAAALKVIGFSPSETDGEEQPEFELSEDQAKFLSCLLEIDFTLTLAEVGHQKTERNLSQSLSRMVVTDETCRCDPIKAAKLLWTLSRSVATGARA
jgi:hypothetical protein